MFFSVVGDNLLLSLYVILFGGAALGCLLGAWRATQVRIPGVRRGLIGLLGTSAGWAALNVAFVLSPSLGMETAGQAWLYDFGLVSGFATVWAWLHLCSAISGQGLHRNRRVRIFAFVVFGGVTLTKLTNPLHELYFTTTAALDPFPHAAVNHHSLFWISLGLSYTLAAVGYFMLYEFLLRTRERTGPLVVLFGLMSLPAIANADWVCKSISPGHQP